MKGGIKMGALGLIQLNAFIRESKKALPTNDMKDTLDDLMNGLNGLEEK